MSAVGAAVDRPAAGELVAAAEPRADVDALAAVTGIARATAAAATASGRHDRASHDGLPASILNTAFSSHPEWHGVGRATAVPVPVCWAAVARRDNEAGPASAPRRRCDGAGTAHGVVRQWPGCCQACGLLERRMRALTCPPQRAESAVNPPKAMIFRRPPPYVALPPDRTFGTGWADAGRSTASRRIGHREWLACSAPESKLVVAIVTSHRDSPT
ncbi:MAG TPA: hypothetical protein VH480_05030 [Streptosporangiaceae bacterium]